jgi:hypothetical protein
MLEVEGKIEEGTAVQEAEKLLKKNETILVNFFSFLIVSKGLAELKQYCQLPGYLHLPQPVL